MKTILITGASAGLGKATAKLFRQKDGEYLQQCEILKKKKS